MRIMSIPAAYLDSKEDYDLLKEGISTRFKALNPGELKRLFASLSPDEVYSLYKVGLTKDSYTFVTRKIGTPRAVIERENRQKGRLFPLDPFEEFTTARDDELRKYVL